VHSAGARTPQTERFSRSCANAFVEQQFLSKMTATSTGSTAPATVPATVDWGRTRYGPAWRRQEELVARRVAGEIGDTLVFTEHEPVYTLGVRPGAERHLLWDTAELARRGIELVETNRGGDITYHGPGQIVGYPIINLARTKTSTPTCASSNRWSSTLLAASDSPPPASRGRPASGSARARSPPSASR